MRTPRGGPGAVALVLAAGVLAALAAQHGRLLGPRARRAELASPEVDAIERDALNAVDPKAQQRTPPERWADPDPWVLDADDFAADFRGAPGQLSEFFSERPRRFAHTDTWDGASWEWPYVPDGQDARGMRSGYDWEGAGSSVSVRGLDMPPDHDVFGELGPFPALSAQDELFPGVRSWDEVVPAGVLPGSQTMGVPFEQPRATAAAPPQQSQALAQRGARGQQQMRLQSLKNVWTDYTQSGDGVKCVCDSAAAGDPEMEGIDPNVKPACTCTGGRTTQFTNTEEGGPLDTGGHGAWPQELPGAARDVPGDGAAYIDGIVGNNAYKARVQALAAVGDEVLAPNNAVCARARTLSRAASECQPPTSQIPLPSEVSRLQLSPLCFIPSLVSCVYPAAAAGPLWSALKRNRTCMGVQAWALMPAHVSR